MEGSQRELAALVQGVTSGLRALDPASFRAVLQKSTAAFLSLLKHKGPCAASKHAVEGGNPATPEGHIRLDPGEVAEVLLLSGELQLDELDALGCLLAAHSERGEASCEAAAGIFFEERAAALQALHRLLQAQALGLLEVPDPIYDAVCAYNQHLLAQEAPGGGCALLQALLAALADTSAEAKAGSRLPSVLDAHGRELPRHLLLQREHTLLCECLLYAARIRPALGPPDVTALGELLGTLALRLRGSDAGCLTTEQQAHCVLVALLAALAGGDDSEAAAEPLARLARSAEAVAKLEGGRPAEEPLLAPARLAWGLLLANHAPPNLRARAERCVSGGLQAGALRCLHAGLLGSPGFEDQEQAHRELVAAVLHRTAVDFLDSEPGREGVEALCAESQAAAGQLPGSCAGGREARPAPDGMEDLLLLLAGAYGAHPDLWLNEGLRVEVVGEFMGGLGGHPVCGESVAVLEAYLAVLAALAGSEAGARAMFAQLAAAAPRMLSWARALAAMQAAAERYAPRAAGGAQAGGGEGDAELLLPEADARGLAAYLGVLTRIFQHAAPADAERWQGELEALCGVSPLWHLLFTLMCCPVPQRLKAALDAALAALAARPATAPQLWERLLRSVVVRGRGGAPAGAAAGAAALPTADLTYQLNEIEARAEDYCETLAFVRLLNALLAATPPGALPDGGRPYAHLAEFVRTDVLGQLSQRGFRDERQRWALAEACLTHLRLWLEALDPGAAAGPKPLALPGVAVLTDLLGERQAMRAALQLLLRGADALAAARKDSPAGAAMEGALLAALRLLTAALGAGEPAVAALRASHENVYLEPLDRALRRHPDRLALLLDLARYPHHPLVQAEAVRLALLLAARTPDLAALLLAARLPGGQQPCAALAAGYGGCLQEGLAAAGEGDERAALVLQLLLAAAEHPSPNLSHLLLGFHVADGPEGVARSLLRPAQAFSCLSVVLEAAQSPSLPAARPALYEGLLELLCELAAAPDSGPPTLDLLREVALLAAQLDCVACAPLPEGADARAASLQQRAWLLRLHALELHHADAAVPAHRESLRLVLRELFAQPPGPDGARELPRWARALAALATPLPPPEAAADDARLRRLHVGLELDALLASRQLAADGGVRAVSRRGHLAYDLAALSAALRARYLEAEQDARRFGAAGCGADLAEACKAALRQAQALNAHVEQAEAQAAALAGWQALLETAVGRRFDLLAALAPALHADGALECGAAEEVCQRVLVDSLALAHALAPGPGARLVPPLVQVAATLLARLQQRAAAGAAPPGFCLPAQLHETLRRLLAVLAAAGERPEVRLPGYGALLAYLSVCRGSGAASLPQPVLAALLEGSAAAAGGVAQAVSEMDALAADVEAGNRELLAREPRLVQLLAGDAVGLSSHPLARTLALALLKTLVAADSGGGLLRAVRAGGLPDRVLQDLADTPRSALLQVGGKALAAAQVALAQAALLLEVTRAGLSRRGDASQLHLAGLTTLRKLCACQVLALQPEAPGLETSAAGGTLRGRLAWLLPPLLRLAVAVVTGLPGSRQVHQAGAALIEAHHACFGRLLDEAASPAVRDWVPGAPEFEQAALVVQLLARLQEAAGGTQAWPPLRQRVFTLALRLGVPDAKSPLPAVRRLGEQLDAGAQADDSARALAGSVFGLRAALAAFLRGAALQPGAPLVLRVLAGEPGSTAAQLPSLLLLADMLKQAAEDLYHVLESQARLLHSLRSRPGAALVPADAAADGRGLAAGRLAAARVAAAGSQQVASLHFLVENLLATICHHLLRHRSEIGNAQDVEQLRRVVAPSLGLLDQMAAGAALGDSAGPSLQALVSRTKDCVARG